MQLLLLKTGLSLFPQLNSTPVQIPNSPSIYRAIAIRPAKAAARPISSLPAEPVDSSVPSVYVPVAALVGLGAAPVAVAKVELPEGETVTKPVPDAEAAAPVPLGLTLPVEVGTSVAMQVLAFVLTAPYRLLVVRTNLDALAVADVCESAQSLLCVIAAEAGDLGSSILGLADGLQVRRVGVLVDGTEEAARRCSDGELCKREEGSSEDGLGKHIGGAQKLFRRLRLIVRSNS